MKFARFFLFSACLLEIHATSFAQVQKDQYALANQYPDIGQACPDFTFNHLHYFDRTKAKLSDFAGKPVILDFFSEGCKACFLTLPLLDSLKKEFAGRVQFVGIAAKSNSIQHQYERYMHHYNLDMPVEYDDLSLFQLFGVRGVPYTVWIDSAGMISQITTIGGLNREAINNLIAGNKQRLLRIENLGVEEHENKGIQFYDYKKPFLIQGNGGADSTFAFRSVLCNWDYRSGSFGDIFLSSKNGNRIEEIGASLKDLLEIAYGDTTNRKLPVCSDFPTLTNHYDQWATHLVVEARNTSYLDAEYGSGKNVFSYALTVPDSLKGNVLKLQKIMQSDLQNYFPYAISVETRSLPYWKLIANKNAAQTLRTKGGNPEWKENPSGLAFKNQPISSLIFQIWVYHQDDDNFIDETNIAGNIDINFDCVMADLNEIRKALNKIGLDLVRAERDFKVIVVRDAKNN